MEKSSIKKLAISGMLTALVFIVTKFAGFTAPFGYFNLGDSVVMAGAILFGGKIGFIAGAFGSALSDALTPGFLIYAPITFFVKGLEGYIVGLIASRKNESSLMRITAVIAGACVMIAGYFIGGAFVLSAVDKNFGLAYAVNELVSTNLLQGAICAAIGYILSTLLLKSKFRW
ncbi:MAG: ECF transporter S component [Clostridia bacterium]|nr:ECF transporter S component [Clostridia bacterium]